MQMFGEYKLFSCTQIIIITPIIWGVFTLINYTYYVYVYTTSKFLNWLTVQMNFTCFIFITCYEVVILLLAIYLNWWNFQSSLVHTWLKLSCQFIVKLLILPGITFTDKYIDRLDPQIDIRLSVDLLPNWYVGMHNKVYNWFLNWIEEDRECECRCT